MQVCLPAGPIDAIRVAQIDECTDLPIPGTCRGYLFNCFRNTELTTNVEEGEQTILRNDSGKKCFTSRVCDELTNVGITFELLNPDYELTNILTGQSLINDGIENIGWFHTDGLNCTPWLCVELFEQVPDEACAAGHRYRRIVLPKVRFKPVGSPTREGQLRIVGFEGQTSAASIAAYGTGPFYDSPFDFGDLDPSIETHIMEFFDSSLDETLEGTCGCLPVFDNNNLLAQFGPGQDELTISDNEGANALCDADEIVITLLGGGTVTIPLPDPNVSVSAAPGCEVTISNLNSYTGGLQVIGVDILENGQSVGDFDANRGLPPGEYVDIQPSPELIELLFPGLIGDGGFIQMGFDAGPGCYYGTSWYNCATDRLAWGFNKKDLYDGDVFRTEIDTTTGTYTVPVVDEWRTPASVWTYGSGMVIEDASTYGLDWIRIRTYDVNDDLICEYTDPVFTWHGGPWLLTQDRCQPNPDLGGGGNVPAPIINNVVVTP
jgi:hypothetical protein